MANLSRTPKQLGQVLRRARKDAGLSQKGLANRCGMWQETISKIESGSSGAKISTIMEICAALDLEIMVTERSKGSSDYLANML